LRTADSGAAIQTKIYGNRLKKLWKEILKMKIPQNITGGKFCRPLFFGLLVFYTL
jgi:hypothetical protein